MRKMNSKVKGYIFVGMYDHPNEEPYVCSTFGCSKRLTLNEQLYGNLCFPCQHLLKVDVNAILKLHNHD